jgi:hypothetical protein
MSAKSKYFKKSGKSKSSAAGKTHENEKKKVNTISDFTYQLGLAKQASDYESATEFFINNIKRAFEYGNDIATALEKLEEIDVTEWKPTLKLSTAADTPTRDLESKKQLEIEFKADYDTYRKRVQVSENNLTKAYALLWERCANATQLFILL